MCNRVWNLDDIGLAITPVVICLNKLTYADVLLLRRRIGQILYNRKYIYKCPSTYGENYRTKRNSVLSHKYVIKETAHFMKWIVI